MESSWKAFLGNVSGSVLFCLDPDLTCPKKLRQRMRICAASGALSCWLNGFLLGSSMGDGHLGSDMDKLESDKWPACIPPCFASFIESEQCHGTHRDVASNISAISKQDHFLAGKKSGTLLQAHGVETQRLPSKAARARPLWGFGRRPDSASLAS